MDFEFFRRNFNFRITNSFVLILILLDILFIFTHVLFICLIFLRVQFDWSISKSFLLNYDRGYPEIFQYFKYFIIIVSLIYYVHNRKIYNYASWLFLFVLFLFDDALQFHERFASWAVERFHFTSMLGLRPQDLGELTYIGVFGPILFLLLILGYYYGNKKIRKTFIDIGLLFTSFLFFGVIVDMLHQLILFKDNRYTSLFMVLLEDGGEMITLSFMTWYFVFLTLKPDNHNTYLYQYLFDKKIFHKIDN